MGKVILIPLFLFCTFAFFSCPPSPDTPQDGAGDEYGSELNPGDVGKFSVSSVSLTTFTLQWISATDSPVPFDQLEYKVYKSDSSNISTAEDALANGEQVGSTLTGFAKGVSMNLEISGMSKTDPPSYYTVVVKVPDGDSAVYNTYIYAMPLVKNLTLNFDDFTSGTGRAGDFLFTLVSNINIIHTIYDTASNFSSMTLRPFHVFGGTLLSQDGISAAREMVFHPAADANIISPIDGVMTKITRQDDYGGTEIDYEIFIAPVEGSGWEISIDHMADPVLVNVGDTVTAGMVLGHPGLHWESSEGITDIGMSELMIISPDNRYWCPFALFDETLKVEYTGKVNTLMLDWEQYITDYDNDHAGGDYHPHTDWFDTQYTDEMSAYCSGCTDQSLDP